MRHCLCRLIYWLFVAQPIYHFNDILSIKKNIFSLALKTDKTLIDHFLVSHKKKFFFRSFTRTIFFLVVSRTVNEFLITLNRVD
jgi:hypothetical protein